MVLLFEDAWLCWSLTSILIPHTIILCLKLGGVETWVVVISKVEEVGS